MTKTAMIYCYNALDKGKARIILSVHDELVIESANSYVETAQSIMKEGMEQAARDMLPNLGSTVIINPSISNKYDK
jgi:DNA polymerase I-like protein with 3'-5' exonuclease and polymerase domains